MVFFECHSGFYSLRSTTLQQRGCGRCGRLEHRQQVPGEIHHRQLGRRVYRCCGEDPIKGAEITSTTAITYSSDLTEAPANDGSVTGSVTATLSGDTFAPASSGTTAAGVSATNVPAGLTAVLTRTSDTVVTLTLTGKATNHADTNDVSDLTITFDDAAFTGGDASSVTDSSKNDIAIDFKDPSSITYAGSFSENAANDGSVTGSITATLSGDTFAAASSGSTAAGVSATNVPPGLSAVLTTHQRHRRDTDTDRQRHQPRQRQRRERPHHHL